MHVHHVVPQTGLGLMEARGVQKDILRVAQLHHGGDAVAGGLGFIGNNGDLLPHDGVGEGGFTHIGPTADGNHSSFRNHIQAPS